MVLFVVAVAGLFAYGLLGIAQQVADTIPTCPVPAAHGYCPTGATP